MGAWVTQVRGWGLADPHGRARVAVVPSGPMDVTEGHSCTPSPQPRTQQRCLCNRDSPKLFYFHIFSVWVGRER